MLTPEGADDAEVIVRPSARGGWQVEIPTSEGVHVTTVDSEQEALALAHSLRPYAEVRILPAAESAETLRDELRPDGQESLGVRPVAASGGFRLRIISAFQREDLLRDTASLLCTLDSASGRRPRERPPS